MSKHVDHDMRGRGIRTVLNWGAQGYCITLANICYEQRANLQAVPRTWNVTSVYQAGTTPQVQTQKI